MRGRLGAHGDQKLGRATLVLAIGLSSCSALRERLAGGDEEDPPPPDPALQPSAATEPEPVPMPKPPQAGSFTFPGLEDLGSRRRRTRARIFQHASAGARAHPHRAGRRAALGAGLASPGMPTLDSDGIGRPRAALCGFRPSSRSTRASSHCLLHSAVRLATAAVSVSSSSATRAPPRRLRPRARSRGAHRPAR